MPNIVGFKNIYRLDFPNVQYGYVHVVKTIIQGNRNKNKQKQTWVNFLYSVRYGMSIILGVKMQVRGMFLYKFITQGNGALFVRLT